MKKKRKNPPTRIYKESKRRPHISRKDTANALLGLGDDIQMTMLESETVDNVQVEDINKFEQNIEACMTESQWEKRDAVVQTSVTMMHLEMYSTESLMDSKKMRKFLFLSKVIQSTLHYTGTVSELYLFRV